MSIASGAWRIERNVDGQPFGISAPETMRDDTDCLCLLGAHVGPHHDSEAHAHAIAALPELLAACKEHGLPGLASDPNGRQNPYGTFADALRNLAAALESLEDPIDDPGWAPWLRSKASSLEATIARAEPKPTTNGGDCRE